MTGYEQDPVSQWNQGQAPPPGERQPPQWNAPGGQSGASQQGGPYGAQQGGPYEQQPYGQPGGPYGQPYGPPGGPYGQPYRPPGGPPPPGATIKTYRSQAVIILLCCIVFGLLPLVTGIPALIYSTRVTENIARGDFAKAVDASRKARTLCWISLGIVLLIIVIVIIIIAVNASKGSSVNTGTGTTGT